MRLISQHSILLLSYCSHAVQYFCIVLVLWQPITVAFRQVQLTLNDVAHATLDYDLRTCCSRMLLGEKITQFIEQENDHWRKCSTQISSEIARETFVHNLLIRPCRLWKFENSQKLLASLSAAVGKNYPFCFSSSQQFGIGSAAISSPHPLMDGQARELPIGGQGTNRWLTLKTSLFWLVTVPLCFNVIAIKDKEPVFTEAVC